jgi:hypothetical protein
MDSDSSYRKGLTVGDARNRQFKVYEKQVEKYNFVDKIITQFKKSKMQNNYGVYIENEGGVIEWVTQIDPLVLGSEADAINDLSEDAAEELAGTLGEGFAPGRPKIKPPNQS